MNEGATQAQTPRRMQGEGRHLLLRASAGTGKTYQLVQRHAALVFDEQIDPAHIVVITFTRKAAAELRQRIERRLLAGGASQAVLAALPQAPIDTFHGLALRLMGQHAMAEEGGAPLAVLGEGEEEEQLFVDSAEAAWLTQPALADDVRAVAGSLSVDAAALARLYAALSRAREDGCSVGGALLGPDYAPAAVFARVGAEFAARRAEVLQDAPAACKTDAAKAALAAFAANEPPPANAPLRVWAAGWRAVWSGANLGTSLKKVLSVADRDKYKAWANAVVAESICAQVVPPLRRLLDAAWRAYVAAKNRQRARDFADLVRGVCQRLEASPELHAAVRRQVRAVMVDEAQDTNAEQRRLLHLLVGLAGPARGQTEVARLLVVGDWKQSIYSFRGANPENFARFAEDVQGMGGGDETLEVSYRSRPVVIDGINALGRHLFGPAYEPLRALAPTDPASVAPAEAPSPAPKYPAAGAAPWRAEGMLLLEVSPAQGAEAETEGEADDDETDGKSKDKKKAAKVKPAEEAEVTADFVCDALAAGTPPNEIAILVGSVRTHGACFVRALTARGVPVVMGGGGGLYARAEVRQWLNLLAWLCDPSATLQAAVALRAPWFALPDDALWALFSRQGRQGETLAALRAGDATPALRVLGAAAGADNANLATARLALGEAAALLPALVQCARSAPPSQAMLELSALLDVPALLAAMPQALQKQANFARLHVLAERAERQERASTAAFAARQLQRMAAGRREDEGAVGHRALRAVTLTTVHGSKGLQWHTVVLPLLDAAGKNGSDAVLYHREQRSLVAAVQDRHASLRSLRYLAALDAQREEDWAQRRRLLYVAVTRAKAQVVFVAPAPGKKPKVCEGTFAKLLWPWWTKKPAELAIVPAASLPRVPTTAPAAPTPEASRARGTRLVEAYTAVAAPKPLPPGAILHVAVTDLVHPERVGKRGRGQSLTALVQQAVAPDGQAAHNEQAQGTLAHEALAYALGEAAPEQGLAAYLAYRGLGPEHPLHARLHRDLTYFLRSSLGRTLHAMGAQQRRHEWPFVLRRTVRGVTGVVRGKVDLLAWQQDAPLIIDFKYALRGANETSYLHQLDTYAWAAAEGCDWSGDVRCLLVYLREHDAPTEHVATVARQDGARTRLDRWVEARCGAGEGHAG